MELFGISDVGMGRHLNEDVCLTFYDNIKNTALLVVCDGMGGAKAGSIASKIAAETFMEHMKSRLAEINNIIEATQHINEAVRAANRNIFDRSIRDAECAGMGTTLVAAAVTNNGVVIANVGDSRAYHVTEHQITQVTKDHSVVEDMIDRGDLTRQEANTHPNRNLITRALGTSQDTEPDFFFLNLLVGEHLFLCSDGLSNIVSEQAMYSEINSESSVQDKCERLISLANSKGAPDNVTVVLFKK